MPACKFRTLEDRILTQIFADPFKGCWWWEGTITKSGYGQMHVGGRLAYTHRVSYELFVGPIPVDKEIDHLCRNRSCCNPKHLEAVSHRENYERGISRQIAGENNRVKTHCPRGHPYAGENLLRDKKGRLCRACRLEKDRRRHERERGGREKLPFGHHQTAKTHCPQGHPYSGDNLIVRSGRRNCRSCFVESNKRYYQRKRAQSQQGE